MTYKEYITEARDHTKKIRKFANVDLIVDWANGMDRHLALWLADKLVKLLKQEAQHISSDVLKKYLKGEKNEKLDRIVRQVIRMYNDNFIRIIDYVNHTAHGEGRKPNINRLNFDEALEKAQEFLSQDRKYESSEKADDGPILITYDDGYYWTDLKTTYSEYEHQMMQHCGKTYEGTTLISLRHHGVPDVTVAWDENSGFTTQIKGRQNDKPEKKYHKYIVDLIIKMKFKGHISEWDPESDFSIDDLSKELYDKVKKENPDYIGDIRDKLEEIVRKNINFFVKDNADALESFVDINKLWDKMFLDEYNWVKENLKEVITDIWEWGFVINFIIENALDYLVNKYISKDNDDIEKTLFNILYKLSPDDIIKIMDESNIKDNFCSTVANSNIGFYNNFDEFIENEYFGSDFNELIKLQDIFHEDDFVEWLVNETIDSEEAIDYIKEAAKKERGEKSDFDL